MLPDPDTVTVRLTADRRANSVRQERQPNAGEERGHHEGAGEPEDMPKLSSSSIRGRRWLLRKRAARQAAPRQTG